MNEVKTRVKQKRNCELSLLLMIFASVSGVFQARLVSLLSDCFLKRNKFENIVLNVAALSAGN